MLRPMVGLSVRAPAYGFALSPVQSVRASQAKSDPSMPVGVAHAGGVVAALPQLHAEQPLGDAAITREVLVGGQQFARVGVAVPPGLAALLDELAQRVLLGPVVGGRVQDGGWLAQPPLLPRQ